MRRRHKIGIVFGVILLLLVGALVAIDRIAVGAAEERIAAQARQELVSRDITTSAEPKVSISGFPFLTQVISGEYKKISISFLSPKASGIQFERIDLAVDTVAADTASILNGTGTVTAGLVTGTATLSWDAVRQVVEVSGLPGVDPSAVEITVKDNVLHLRLPLTVTGQQGAVVADGTLQVQDGVIKVQLTNVRAEGAASSPALQRIIDQNRSRMSASLKIPAMPYKLVINKVSSGPSGLTIVASAANVALAGQ